MTKEESRRNTEAFFRDAVKISADLEKIKADLSALKVEIKEKKVEIKEKVATLRESDRRLAMARKDKSCEDISRRFDKICKRIAAL